MLIFSSRRVFSLLLFSLFHIEGVFCRGGRKSAGKGIGKAAGSSSDINLPPYLIAVFALTIVIAIITLYQLGQSLKRFKRLQLPEGEPALPYNVGTLFRIFLTSYTVVYLLNNVLYAVYVARFGGNIFLPPGFQTGMIFTGQFSIVLFYATFLSIIAYRQRIQLNPGENRLNLKSFLDGWLLATVLILAVAGDAVFGDGIAKSIEDRIAVANLALAYEVFGFLASLDVAISSFMARARLSKADIKDKIINISAFAVSPIVVSGGVFRIIDISIQRNAGISLNFRALLIASVAIEGIVSITAIWCCLLMGAPPKPPKSDGKGTTVEKKV